VWLSALLIGVELKWQSACCVCERYWDGYLASPLFAVS